MPWQDAFSTSCCAAGQVRVGGVWSVTCTLKVHVLVNPAPSVAVSVTTVVPNGRLVPAAGDWVTAPEGNVQLSVAVANAV